MIRGAERIGSYSGYGLDVRYEGRYNTSQERYNHSHHHHNTHSHSLNNEFNKGIGMTGLSQLSTLKYML